MITKNHRFHGYNSLRYVYRQGKTVRTPQLAIRYALNDRRNAYRCAVVVSKSVSKSAVVRNRIRRRVYEAVRSLDKQVGKPYDLVITIFQPVVAELPAPELGATISKLLSQAGVLPDSRKNTHDIIDTKEP